MDSGASRKFSIASCYVLWALAYDNVG
jgi:hypothetical protein